MTLERIGLISAIVPLADDETRRLVDWLESALRARGHKVEAVLLPATDAVDTLLTQATAYHLMELDQHFDRVITLNPPAHVARHRRKVCWITRHDRRFYDLWEGGGRGWGADNGQARALRDSLRRIDSIALGQAHRLFAASKAVATRLRTGNGLEAPVLYPPLLLPDLFICEDYGEEIVSIGRLDGAAHQRLLIQAMCQVTTPVRLRLSGATVSPGALAELQALVDDQQLASRVILDPCVLDEREMAARLAGCLALAHVSNDSELWAQAVLAAAQAGHTTVTTSDSAAVLEFIINGENGVIVDPQPEALAQAFDRLYQDRAMAARLGRAAQSRIDVLGISEDAVIAQLLS